MHFKEDNDDMSLKEEPIKDKENKDNEELSQTNLSIIKIVRNANS